MVHILNNFADLGILKKRLSTEDVVPHVKERLRQLETKPLARDIDYNYASYLDAAAAAVKAYPVLLVNHKRIDFSSNKKERYLAFKAIGHRFYFRYDLITEKRTFKSTRRESAFKTLLFFFREVRLIAACQITIIENTSAGCFVLSINEIPLIASSYKSFTSTIAKLKEIKKQVLEGALESNNLNEEDAIRMGVSFREKVYDSLILNELQIIPELDYSSFSHNEIIRVSSRRGHGEDGYDNSVGRNASPVVYGRSKLEETKTIQGNPWMAKWDDRFDHDD